MAHESDGHGNCSFFSPPVPKTKSWSVCSHATTYGRITLYVVCVFAMLLTAACRMWVGVFPTGHSPLPLPIVNGLTPATVTLLRATKIIIVST